MNELYYNENILESIDQNIINAPCFLEWLGIVKDILLSDEFQKRKLFNHHHNMSVWDHSILVSYKSFMLASYYNADKNVCAIAGLLHDFYEDAWLWNENLAKLEDGRYVKEVGVRKPLLKMHGFTHGKVASLNYVKYFPHLENKKITDSILKHMFPLTIIPPKYREGYIITCVDKLNSVRELPGIKYVTVKLGNKTISKFKEIIKHH